MNTMTTDFFHFKIQAWISMLPILKLCNNILSEFDPYFAET